MAAAAQLTAAGGGGGYGEVEAALSAELPGLSATWFMAQQAPAAPEVRARERGAAGAAGVGAWSVSGASNCRALAPTPPRSPPPSPPGTQVLEVSRRLLALRQLLGGAEGVDIVFMVVREPRLLSSDFGG